MEANWLDRPSSDRCSIVLRLLLGSHGKLCFVIASTYSSDRCYLDGFGIRLRRLKAKQAEQRRGIENEWRKTEGAVSKNVFYWSLR